MICDCDLLSMICDKGRATTMRGERAMAMMRSKLRQPRSEYWGFFGLVLPFWYRGSILVFFLINTVLLLVCFAFALYRLYQCIGDWFSLFSLFSLQRRDRGYGG